MIIQADILKWAEQYEGEPFHAALCGLLSTLGALYLRICATVARFAESDEVCQFVRLFIALHAEQTERLNMMNTLAGSTAFLACVIIALQRFTALRGPVRPAIIVPSVDILRMVQSMAMLVTTWARTVFAAALLLSNLVLIHFKGYPATKTYALYFGLARTRLNRCILAGSRAMLTAPMLQPSSLASERVAAMFTDQLNSCGVNASVYGLLAQVRDIAALHRAVLRLRSAIRLDIKGFPTRLTNECFHTINYTINIGRRGYCEITL